MKPQTMDRADFLTPAQGDDVLAHFRWMRATADAAQALMEYSDSLPVRERSAYEVMRLSQLSVTLREALKAWNKTGPQAKRALARKDGK